MGGVGPIAVAVILPPPFGIGGVGPIAVATTLPPPFGIGGVGPIAVATTLPPPFGIGGVGPIAVAQNAGAERLEAENVAAFAVAIFRSPIAPVNTSNTRATTVRHLDIGPPEGKLTRRDSKYFCSLMEQKSYIVPKRLTPMDNVPTNGLCRPVRGSSARIVRN